MVIMLSIVAKELLKLIPKTVIRLTRPTNREEIEYA